MKIFFKELKYRFKKNLFLFIGLLLFIYASMTKYATFEKSPQLVSDLVDKLPNIIKVIYGINNVDLLSLSGYYSVIHMYLTLIFAIIFSLLIVNIFEDEVIDKTVDFLYIMPISRFFIFLQKIIYVFFSFLILLLLLYFFTLQILSPFSKHLNFLVELYIGIFFTTFHCMSISLFCYAFFKKIKVTTIVIIYILSVYLLDILASLNTFFSHFKFLSIFNLFAPASILDNGLNYFPIFFIFGSSCFLFFISYLLFSKRDL